MLFKKLGISHSYIFILMQGTTTEAFNVTLLNLVEIMFDKNCATAQIDTNV